MFGLRGIVSSLGLGESAVLAATLLVTAFYVYRAVGIARIVTGAVGALTRETLVLLVVAAIVLGLGWASPNAGVMLDHVRTAGGWIDDRGLGLVRRVVGWVVDVIS